MENTIDWDTHSAYAEADHSKGRRCSPAGGTVKARRRQPVESGRGERERGADVRQASGQLKMSVLFCHAAGFCAEAWRPVIDELSALARQSPGASELVMSAIDLPGSSGLG